MSARGFTLVELLVAAVISLLVVAGALLFARAAQTALAVEPAAMDTARRLRQASDVISAAISGAGGERGIGDDHATIGAWLPSLRLTSADGRSFSSLAAIRAVHGGRGRLAQDQPGPGGPLALDTEAEVCPRSGEVCGFSPGDVAVAFDERGHFDLFIIGTVDAALNRVVPRAPLTDAYRAGAWIVAVRYERFVLLRQPDGAQTLTRITAAGAREPMVDGVTGLELVAWGAAAPPGLVDGVDRRGFAQYGLPPPAADETDPEAIFANGSHCLVSRETGAVQSTLPARPDTAEGLTTLLPADLDDGPWCPHEDAANRFDADWLRLRRVDLRLRVEVTAPELRGPAGQLFARAGTGAHDASRWVHDRVVHLSVAVGR